MLVPRRGEEDVVPFSPAFRDNSLPLYLRLALERNEVTLQLSVLSDSMRMAAHARNTAFHSGFRKFRSSLDLF